MSVDKREAAVMKNFILTDRMHRRLFENRTAVMGVHRSQHRILMYLAKRNEAPAQKEIAEQFDVSPAAVAVTLKKLEDAGYIKRSSLKNDNRVNTVSITDKAREVVEQTKQFSEELEKAVFADFSDAELAAFEKSLEKMQRAMRAYEEKQAARPEGESAQ